MKVQTKAIHAGNDNNLYGTCNTPIYQSAAYRFQDSGQAQRRFALEEGGPIYTRIGNPTESALEERLAALFGGPALALASGSAAVLYSVLNLCHAGDTVMVAQNVYGGTFDLFSYTIPNMGIKVVWFNPADINTASIMHFIEAHKPKAVFAESVANPNADVTDIESLGKLCKAFNTKLIVDNTFTPLICDPFSLGADVVVHSATKFICGNGSTMGGCIIENPESTWEGTYLSDPDPSYHGAVFSEVAAGAPFTTRTRCVILRDTGACISPFNSWCLLNGLETLPLRLKEHIKNAEEVIAFLQSVGVKVNHGAVDNTEIYNRNIKEGAVCSIFTIEVGSSKEEAQKFCDNLKLFYQLANVGDAKSLVTHPATTTHSQLSVEELKANNITPTTVRLSIGIEDVQDIINDLDQALYSIKH